MRQPALTVALVFLFTGVSALAEAQDPKDPKQAEQRCNAGDSKACVRLGNWYWLGWEGLKQDRTLGMSLYERACNGGDGQGCYLFANGMQYTDKSVKKYSERPLQYYQKACDLKYGDGCYEVGQAYAQGEGVGQDYKRALALYEQACEFGSEKGCEGGANLHNSKTGTFPDAKRWATFKEKACDLGYAATCFVLGLNYDLGMSVPKDPVHANELFKKACLFGKEEACKLVVRK